MDEQSLKNVMYIMIAVAIVLAGALAYIWWQKATLVNELTIEKEELIADFINFDLRTLTDTLDADEQTRSVVRNMLSTIAANDTVCMMIVGDFYYTYTKVDTLANGKVNYEVRDTVLKYPAYTNYADLKGILK